VHKGNVKPAMQLLQPYLPKEGGGASTSAYSEGGALYALGLIHAGAGVSNHAAGASALEYLKAALANAAAQEDEVSIHSYIHTFIHCMTYAHMHCLM
jgi:26S proteasome regulatory subunit N2